MLLPIEPCARRSCRGAATARAAECVLTSSRSLSVLPCPLAGPGRLSLKTCSCRRRPLGRGRLARCEALDQGLSAPALSSPQRAPPGLSMVPRYCASCGWAAPHPHPPPAQTPPNPPPPPTPSPSHPCCPGEQVYVAKWHETLVAGACPRPCCGHSTCSALASLTALRAWSSQHPPPHHHQNQRRPHQPGMQCWVQHPSPVFLSPAKARDKCLGR